MKIVGGEYYIVALPLRRQHTWASNTQVAIGRHALVRVDTDEGVSGWGEASALATWGGQDGARSGETPETVTHLGRDYLLPAISGCDPLEISVIHDRMDRVVKGNPYAKAAVDMACYDAAGKAAERPVWALLGGKYRDGVQLAHSLGLLSMQECLAETRQSVDEGVRTIKVKTGHDPQRDVEVVRRLREEFPDLRIRVDANEGYHTVHDAIAVTREQEQFDIMLCEQPVVSDTAMARVAAAISTPVMADESAWTATDIVRLHRMDAAACYSLYVTKPGGLYRARQQADIAENLGLYSDVGGSIEMGIANAANLHLAAATKNAWLPSVCPVTTLAGAEGPQVAGVYYVDDVITTGFGFRNGEVQLPEGPGLGIEVDPDKLAKYAESAA